MEELLFEMQRAELMSPQRCQPEESQANSTESASSALLEAFTFAEREGLADALPRHFCFDETTAKVVTEH